MLQIRQNRTYRQELFKSRQEKEIFENQRRSQKREKFIKNDSSTKDRRELVEFEKLIKFVTFIVVVASHNSKKNKNILVRVNYEISNE